MVVEQVVHVWSMKESGIAHTLPRIHEFHAEWEMGLCSELAQVGGRESCWQAKDGDGDTLIRQRDGGRYHEVERVRMPHRARGTMHDGQEGCTRS